MPSSGPGNKGACCSQDGTCQENRSQAQCKSPSTFNPGMTCAQANCGGGPGNGKGACCSQDGSCQENRSRGQCKSPSTFNLGKTCAQAQCGGSSGNGACCKSNSQCSDGPASSCPHSGSFTPGKTCNQVQCAPGNNKGACCKPDGTCQSNILRSQCKEGGIFNPGQTCDQAQCASQAPFIGACCKSGSCQDGVPSTDCVSSGGSAFNSSCVANAGGVCGQPGPTGACCVGTDQCQDVSSMACRKLGGRFQSTKKCSDNVCSNSGPGVSAAAAARVCSVSA